MKRKFIGISAALLFLGTSAIGGKAVAAEANSAPAYWEGTSATGAIVKDENCPVVVEKEALHLNVSTLPYEERGKNEKYAAEVSAEYSFYNPTDSDIDMTLLFPFGKVPSYGIGKTENETFGVTADGKSVECRVRYSYEHRYGFDIDSDMACVRDEKRQDPFYVENTPVREYRLSFNVPEGGSSRYLKSKLCFNPKKTRVLFPVENNVWLNVSNGDMYARSYLRKSGETAFTFYAAGEALDEIEAKLYEDERVLSDVSSPVTADMTFSEFVLSRRNADSPIGEIDWYNAFLDMLEHMSERDGSVSSFGLDERFLLRWFEYELSIPKNGRVVNTVRAPLYPAIEGRRNRLYSYSYLLSPAGKWADFKGIEITIDTPYYLSSGSLDFTRTNKEGESGFVYRYSRSSLPMGELTFVLTEDETYSNAFDLFGPDFLFPAITWVFVTLIAFAAVASVVMVIVCVSLRKKKK